MTDIDNLGRHLLGRKKSPYDARDYRAANFMDIGRRQVDATPAELVQLGVEELTKTTIKYKDWATRKYADVTVTHWWKAFNYFAQVTNTNPPQPHPSGDRLWESKIQLDQGDTGHCVGFGYAAWGIADPIQDVYSDQDGHDIYYETKVIEGDPGGENGAYPRDGAKAMVKRGRMQTYAFLQTETDILKWLRNTGPIGVGTDWLFDMFYPNDDGLVTPTGSYQGGHFYLLIGIEGEELIFKNSWGANWGDHGYFRMKVADFMYLMSRDGEAVASVELPW